jgi:hypothetical protein
MAPKDLDSGKTGETQTLLSRQNPCHDLRNERLQR